jgi:transposase
VPAFRNVRLGSCKTSTSGCGCIGLWAAVEPTTGTGVFLLLPSMEGQCLELFLRHLRHELGKGPIGVVLDSSGSHRSAEVRWPRGMHPLSLPPYSPELNPAEQVFRHIRKHLSNTVFTTLDELQNALIDLPPAVLGASHGLAPAHRLSVVGRGSHLNIISYS